MPRPDIARLGINYRRIPILSIGRDVYLDTPLIMSKLNQAELGRTSLVGGETVEQKAMTKLLESSVLDTGLFLAVVLLMLPKLPGAKDSAFMKDRADLVSSKTFYPPQVLSNMTPDAITRVKRFFHFLETTLLSDGRQWILGTSAPSQADIEAVWPLCWLTQVPSAIPEQHISSQMFPKTFAWIQRFEEAVASARETLGKPSKLTGQQAAEMITSSPFNESESQVDTCDPVVQHQSLKKGQLVHVWPTDSGSRYKEHGELLSINDKEIVLGIKAGDVPIHVHTPRNKFAIRADEGNTKL